MVDELAAPPLTILEDCVRRWRTLGGLVAVDVGSRLVETLEEEEAGLRALDWLYFVCPDATRVALTALPDADATPVLRASAYAGVSVAAPYKDVEGEAGGGATSWKVRSWGDWEIEVDRIVPQPGMCQSLLDLAIRELQRQSWDELSETHVSGGKVEMCPTAMFNAKSVLRSVVQGVGEEGDAMLSWDTVLEHLGENVRVDMFGAEGTTVKQVLKFVADGNDKIFFVEVKCGVFYRCALETS